MKITIERNRRESKGREQNIKGRRRRHGREYRLSIEGLGDKEE